jgi:hypothetical protein
MLSNLNSALIYNSKVNCLKTIIYQAPVYRTARYIKSLKDEIIPMNLPCSFWKEKSQ